MAADLDAELGQLRARAEADPELLPSLAQALAEASAIRHRQNRAPEAARHAADAVEIVRRLALDDADFRDSLPAALSALSARSLDLGDVRSALDAGREAVDLAAALEGEDAPLTLAIARFNLSAALLESGAWEEAGGVLRAIGRSVRRLFEAGDRELAARVYQSLKRAAEQARADGKWTDYAAYHRALAESLPGDPPAARGLLAQALDRAAEALAASDPALAVRIAEEATAVLARLAQDDPKYAAPRQEVAGRWLGLAGELDDPLVTERAARAAAEGAQGGERAGVLLLLAVALSDQGRGPEAIDVVTEALALWRALPTVAPDGDGALMVEALRRLARLLAAEGRHDEALAVAAEGLERCVAGVMHAGVGDPDALAELERLHEECLRAVGRAG